MFETRALEFNGKENVWLPHRILQALDHMQRTGLNTLVLNDISIAERLAYPGAYFGSGPSQTNVHSRYSKAFRSLYAQMPGGRSRRYKDVEYVRWVIRRARERGIEVYLNNKEIFFPDAILQVRPELQRDGVVCPTDPFWGEFLQVKYTEIFQDLPGLKGMITSPATGESRVSIAHNHCTCSRCSETRPADWYTWIISSIHGPAQAHGVELVVRDFVFDRRTQDDLAEAWDRLPQDIVVCLKYTPHDYYPTFAHNPRISEVHGRPTWVEFDAMGQYFGWGVAPAIVIEDTRGRMDYATTHGVTGVLCRVDWEAHHGHSCFETPNLVNLHAFGLLATDVQTARPQIWLSWLEEIGALPERATAEEIQQCVPWLESTLGRSWDVVEGTLYAHGCVFSDSSTFPVSIDHAFWLGEEKNSRRDWEPEYEHALDADASNVADLIEEKWRAIDLAGELRRRVEASNPGFKPGFHAELVQRFEIFELYVTGFAHAMTCAGIARHVLAHGSQADEGLRSRLPAALEDAAAYCDLLDRHEIGDLYPACLLLAGQRLRSLVEDVREQVTV